MTKSGGNKMTAELCKTFRSGKEAREYTALMITQGYKVVRTTACKGGLRYHFVIVSNYKSLDPTWQET